MNNGKLLQMKKSTMIDIKDFYLGTYYYGIETITALLIDRGHYDFLDFDNDRAFSIGNVGYLEPLSKYIGVSEGQISIKTAIEMAKNYFAVFNKENIGKPKRWEPKVLLKDAVPYLKVTNSLVDDSSNSEDDLELGI